MFKKSYNMLEGKGWWICVQNFKSISSTIAEMWHKTCQKQSLFTSFRDFTVISRILFLPILTLQKVLWGSFFAFFAKNWSQNMYRSSKSRNFLLDLFYLVTWDDLDLYYNHKAQEMIFTNVSDTIHADSLALFALNIEIVLADVTKHEISNILTLTWPVTLLVTTRSL